MAGQGSAAHQQPCRLAPRRSGVRGFPHWGLWLQRNSLFTRDVLAFMLEGGCGWAGQEARAAALEQLC